MTSPVVWPAAQQCRTHILTLAWALSLSAVAVHLVPLANAQEAQAVRDQRSVNQLLPDPQRRTSVGRQPQWVNVVAAAGSPFGVGRLEIRFDGSGPQQVTDPTPFLTEGSGRLYYPALSVHSPGVRQGELDRLVVHFLCQGGQPLQLALVGPDGLRASISPVAVQTNDVLFQQLLNQWWTAYTAESGELYGEHRLLRNHLATTLARRLGLSLPAGFLQRNVSRETTALEHRFQRAVSTMFGIDSVLLAMQQQEELRVTVTDVDRAASPLPLPLNVRRAVLPPMNESVAVESISLYVPQECYYVRCSSLDDFAWLRRFLQGWGGELREIVPNTIIDRQTRRRLETQIGLSLAESQRLELGGAISDVALLGSDLLFRDGPSLGVLMEARDSDNLAAKIEYQREAVRRAHPDATRQTTRITGHVVSLVASPDNRVRSFYAIQDRYHLVSNSRQLVLRFLECRQKRSSVGDLNEFRYARAKVPAHQPLTAFLYVSDPFFRQLVSPEYRIEMARRVRARSEIQQVQLARIVAQQEGFAHESVGELLDAGFLPQGFNKRPDAGRTDFRRQVAWDSLRGGLGTFLPVGDVQVSAATRQELEDYRQFAERYRQQWRVMDPVIVTMNAQPAGHDDQEIVDLKILVTPFARVRYAYFATYLGAAGSTCIAPPEDELLGISAVLDDPRGESYQVRVGLLDDAVPYRIQDGKVCTQGDFLGGTLASRNSYALLTPSGETGLQLLSEFVRHLQSGRVEVDNRLDAAPGSSARVPGASSPGTFWDMVIYGFLNALLERLYVSAVEHRQEWSTVARAPAIRQRALAKATLLTWQPEAQVRLRMADPARAAAAPYIHSYMYMQARRASASNAELLHFAGQQLNLSPYDARQVVERLFNGRLICPLGGMYRLDRDGDFAYWTSTAWQKRNYRDEIDSPPDYRCGFLAWLHGLEARMSLDRDMLMAEVQLRVVPRPTSN